VSRLTTKQRRARLWRRDWCKDAREMHADPPEPTYQWGGETRVLWGPGQWDALVPHMADYAQALMRGKTPSALGLKIPQQREAYWKRMAALDARRAPADGAKETR
jgi:hypothetical protein